MGIYYRGISKRTKEINGMKFAFATFHGKAPGLFSDYTGPWNRFLTRSTNTAEIMKDEVQYILMDDKLYDGVPVAKWNGKAVMSDIYWDDNIIGSFIKVGKSYVFKPNGL